MADDDAPTYAELLARWLGGEPVASIHERAEDALRRVLRASIETSEGVSTAVVRLSQALEREAADVSRRSYEHDYLRGYAAGVTQALWQGVSAAQLIYAWTVTRGKQVLGADR